MSERTNASLNVKREHVGAFVNVVCAPGRFVSARRILLAAGLGSRLRVPFHHLNRGLAISSEDKHAGAVNPVNRARGVGPLQPHQPPCSGELARFIRSAGPVLRHPNTGRQQKDADANNVLHSLYPSQFKTTRQTAFDRLTSPALKSMPWELFQMSDETIRQKHLAANSRSGWLLP